VTSPFDVDACLPAELHGATVTKIAAGLSGAGVYRVDAAGQAFVLKISAADEPLAGWRRKIRIRQLAAEAGVAPRVIHVDESRRAVLSVFVADRSFPALLMNPHTRESALALLGHTLRRVHEIPLPSDADARDPREFAAGLWSGLEGTLPLPTFVIDAVRRALAEEPPVRERALVLSHNDVNPTNLVYDGEHLLLLDWETAGANDPYYDLASISVFARLDDETCQRLLAAYEGAPVGALPARFAYFRRLVSAMAGTLFLRLARQSGHPGTDGTETLDSTPSLGAFYQRVFSGGLAIASGEGQWWFGLALIKTSIEL
jgi:aminoglycoside phosphotransferase (APT) family kinase protein